MQDSEKNRSADEDSDLVARLRAGDRAALARLHERHLDRVFGYVVRRVARREDAEDITCEVFGPALRALSAFRGEANLSTYLIGIARRKIADHLRRRTRVEILEADLPPNRPSPFDGVDWSRGLPHEFVERREVADAVRQAVALLPAAQREALLLRYTEGLSHREIGQILNRSENSVKALLHRAKANLQERLTPTGEARTNENSPRRALPFHCS